MNADLNWFNTKHLKQFCSDWLGVGFMFHSILTLAIKWCLNEMYPIPLDNILSQVYRDSSAPSQISLPPLIILL